MNTLELNHQDMNTIVETFFVEETQELIHDAEKLDDWNAKVRELGLKGQEKICAKDKSPIPFLPMKTSLVNTFKVLCPRQVSVEEYSISPIPLEILKLVSLSSNERYFNKIEIWYDDVKPDPVCVGYIGHWIEYDWYQDSNKSLKGCEFKSEEEAKQAGAVHPHFNEVQKYLIGKWGDVKHSFEELKRMAKARFIEEKAVEFKRQIKRFQRELDDLELEASERF